MGEMIGLRISTGVYINRTFGVIPRMAVWGLLGMGINMAMIIFSKGVPMFMEYMGMANAAAIINGEFCLDKLWIALAISVAMNTIFAPVFMTLHKITDTHILMHGGTLRGFFTPLDMGGIMSSLNWRVLWGFVFKKTIPFFWFPAHTITFLLPGNTGRKDFAMKRPLAYITAPWSNNQYENAENAATYCRQVYDAGYSPICPVLFLSTFLKDEIPQEHKDGLDMVRDYLRRSHVLVVCGHTMTEAMKNDIAVAQRLGITATTLEGILTVKGQGKR